MAGVDSLAWANDIDIIGNYTERFPYADPDFIEATARFDTVMTFTIIWKQKREYHERFNDAKEKMKEQK